MILLYRHPYKIPTQFYNINHDIHSYFMYAFNLPPIMKIGVELTHQKYDTVDKR